MIKLTTIEEIRAHQFVGNYHSDYKAFAQIDSFAQNPHLPIAHRAEALRCIYKKGMGLEGEEAGDNLTDVELLKQYEEQQGS